MRLFRRRRFVPQSEPPVTDALPTQPRRVFDALARHRVDYVTIGGVAVQAYGHVRTTQDVDIVAAGGRANLERLAAALSELRAHLRGVDPADPAALAAGANFTLTTAAGPLDVCTDTDELRGSPPWEELVQRAHSVRLPNADLQVVVAAREDLIALKRAAAPARASDEKRRLDLDDIVFLAGSSQRGRTPDAES